MSEKVMVLKMLEEGKITAVKASELLQSLEAQDAPESVAAGVEQSYPQLPKLGAKYDLAEIKIRLNDEQFKKIINTHAFGASAAAISAAIPAVGSKVAVTVSLGFVGTMYFRLANHIGVVLSKDVIKAMASAVVAQGGTFLVSTTLFSAVTSLIPIAGTATAVAVMAPVNFGLVKLSGTIFQKVMWGMLSLGKDIEELSKDDIRELVKSSMSDSEMKAAMESYKTEFTESKASGEYDQVEKANAIDEFKE